MPKKPSGACSGCGELTCLCRPRFFAGQLLTEDDLNRLDRYVVEKNKLHNRYLHGTGVVGGLEVVCHTCKGHVLVKAGYAISPSGEDIVVCKDEAVPVCKLIDDCRVQTRRDVDCTTPYGADHSVNCEDETVLWALAVRYEEKPSRGITPLRGSTEAACCSRCGCGGSSDCGCSCHQERANGKKKSSVQKSCKQAPSQCEPTMTCEGYRFEVFKVFKTDPPSEDWGRMFNCLLACASPLVDRLAQLKSDYEENPTPAEMREICGELKESLLEFFRGHQKQYCGIIDCLSGIDCSESGGGLSRLFIIWQAALFQCIQSALLPPCPEPARDPRIVLATFTVEGEDCKVTNICNWTALRKFVTTFPNLQYWLSFIPSIRNERQGLEELCHGNSALLGKTCGAPIRKKVAAKAVKYQESFREAAHNKVFRDLVMNAVGGKLANAGPEELFMGAIGAKDDKGNPILTDLERNNIPQLLLINQVLAPVLKQLVPDNLTSLLRVFGASESIRGKAAESASAEETRAMKEELTEMKATIETLKKKVNL